jgi:DNA-directed RNA polymerase specialized sigma24 family protein
MDSIRAEVEAAAEAFIDAIADLRRQLEINEALVHQALNHFRSGASMARTMTEVPSAGARASAQDAVRSFYAGKNRMRVAVTTAALEEGLSVAEIAEVFTIPHDVVASISAEHPRTEVS